MKSTERAIKLYGSLIACPLFFMASTVSTPIMSIAFCFLCGWMLGQAVTTSFKESD